MARKYQPVTPLEHPPEHLPTNEKEYTKVFQSFIADGISLKQEITTELFE